MGNFLLSRLAECAEREVRWRRRVYPNRVNARRMSQRLADSEIAMMTEIGELLRALAKDANERRGDDDDERQCELFGSAGDATASAERRE